MITLNLGIRFLAELAGIAALAVWGYSLPSTNPWRILLGVIAPALLVVVWARWIAPKSDSPLTQRSRMVVGSGLLLITALLLAVAGFTTWASLFAAVIVLNTAVLITRSEGTNV